MPRLTELTWSEIRDLAAGGALAILPLGSLEQHGPHLPVVTDTALVDAVAAATVERLERELPVVLAPTLWIGASNHHQGFFALSLSETTYIEALVETIASFEKAGFKRLFVLNGHGGNSSPLRIALSRARQAGGSMIVAAAEYWGVAASALKQLRRTKPGGAAHAGEIETSLMLHVNPEAVRRDLIDAEIPELPAGFTIDLIEAGPVALSFPWQAVSGRGQIGDPTGASAEQGARFFEAATEALSDVLREFYRLEPRETGNAAP